MKTLDVVSHLICAVGNIVTKVCGLPPLDLLSIHILSLAIFSQLQ
jgi:hypothetical protein